MNLMRLKESVSRSGGFGQKVPFSMTVLRVEKGQIRHAQMT